MKYNFLLMMFASVLAGMFSRCGTEQGNIELAPVPVTKIFKEGSDNFCYLTITNKSTSDPCQIAIESPTTYLKQVSAIPTLSQNILNPLQSVEVKYQVLWNPTMPCPSPGTGNCNFDKIRVMAKWANEDQEEGVDVRWSTPVVQTDCYVTDAGGNDDNYRGLLCDHPQPNNNTAPGSLFKNVGDIYNPNDFEIEVLVDNPVPHAQVCIATANHNVAGHQWVKVPAHSFYPYGDKIRMNFGGSSGPCNMVNPASISVYSKNWTLIAGGAKWIALRVSYQ